MRSSGRASSLLLRRVEFDVRASSRCVAIANAARVLKVQMLLTTVEEGLQQSPVAM